MSFSVPAFFFWNSVFLTSCSCLILLSLPASFFVNSAVLTRFSSWITFWVSAAIFSAFNLSASLNSVCKLVKRLLDEILTSWISQVSSQIPQPVRIFYISSLTPPLNLLLFLRISLIVKLAILSRIIATAIDSILPLATCGVGYLRSSPKNL